MPNAINKRNLISNSLKNLSNNNHNEHAQNQENERDEHVPNEQQQNQNKNTKEMIDDENDKLLKVFGAGSTLIEIQILFKTFSKHHVYIFQVHLNKFMKKYYQN